MQKISWIEYYLSRPLPDFPSWGLLAIALVGLGLDRDTGFWLVLPVASNILVAVRARAALPDQQPLH